MRTSSSGWIEITTDASPLGSSWGRRRLLRRWRWLSWWLWWLWWSSPGVQEHGQGRQWDSEQGRVPEDLQEPLQGAGWQHVNMVMWHPPLNYRWRGYSNMFFRWMRRLPSSMPVGTTTWITRFLIIIIIRVILLLLLLLTTIIIITWTTTILNLTIIII